MVCYARMQMFFFFFYCVHLFVSKYRRRHCSLDVSNASSNKNPRSSRHKAEVPPSPPPPTVLSATSQVIGEPFSRLAIARILFSIGLWTVNRPFISSDTRVERLSHDAYAHWTHDVINRPIRMIYLRAGSALAPKPDKTNNWMQKRSS